MGIFDWKSWVVILIVVVLVFGTSKLKNLGSDLGSALRGFKKALDDDEPPKNPANSDALNQAENQTTKVTKE